MHVVEPRFMTADALVWGLLTLVAQGSKQRTTYILLCYLPCLGVPDQFLLALKNNIGYSNKDVILLRRKLLLRICYCSAIFANLADRWRFTVQMR